MSDAVKIIETTETNALVTTNEKKYYSKDKRKAMAREDIND